MSMLKFTLKCIQQVSLFHIQKNVKHVTVIC